MTPSRLLITVAALLGFSTLAFANSINSGTTSFSNPASPTVQNVGGTYSNPGGGLALSGATLSFVSGLSNVSSDITALDFSIGAPNSGSIAGGFALWTSGAGSSFTFSDTTQSLTFIGSFSCSALQPCVFIGSPAGFSFSPGWITGLLNGTHISGLTSQVSLTAVPEIGTLGMVGMGLLGIAGLTKRKFSAVARRLRMV
jgi:hypothetical protein